MKKYSVSVRATYYDDIEVEAEDSVEAYKKAIKQFSPNSDNLFSIDVYGLSPWDTEGDPHADDKYMDEMRGAG